MSTKTTIMDDWWNAGFDNFFEGVPIKDNTHIENIDFREKWADGWLCAAMYQSNLRRANIRKQKGNQ